tara:strand:+ start:3204 stop:3512 length:309 start_codon:yes stop_codon:yes gene_type:complete
VKDEEVRDLRWEKSSAKFKEQLELCEQLESSEWDKLDDGIKYNFMPTDVVELIEMLIETAERTPRVKDTLLVVIKQILKDYPHYKFYKSGTFMPGFGIIEEE